ncbi:hypothetical protein [Anaplasma phagocytophilum]|uniref:Uncharacterized protein n=1 Tax=Anaplasma phagocytophilum str. CRT38 TaxID=1269275 RepID=S6G8D8_ANAPH|nr:hypothetical protein [Anaplasma phagocytophilum]EOA62543.1 hypothetical protein CRT38_04747 [Anaplasma phagocytophilum str. CRT38]KDB56916.1 hypothetical protein P030_06090 [Anaplasma phagocytophilum str. CRT35]KDB56922.1 hypothetical protein P030_06250 [Anaplasma phagocytophilum str. CRT35]
MSCTDLEIKVLGCGIAHYIRSVYGTVRSSAGVVMLNLNAKGKGVNTSCAAVLSCDWQVLLLASDWDA